MQGHLPQQGRDAAPPFVGQPFPNRRRQIAHREIQANAPMRSALETRFSVIRRNPSIYERHCQWDIERFFQIIKQFRAIATRYEKTARNFLAGLQLVCALAWLK